MDADDRKLFAASLRRLIEEQAGGTLDKGLDDLGWQDALREDPEVAVSVLFERQGALNCTSTALGGVLTAAAGLDVDIDVNTVVVLPAAGHYRSPGTHNGHRLEVDGLIYASSLSARTAIVVVRDGSRYRKAQVPMAEVVAEPIRGIDPELGLVRVRADAPVAGVEGLALVDWPAAIAAAQLALAHELVGASRTMLSLARDHAVDRVQFGRSIASFQAVRHRLADSLVALQSADAATLAAWTAPSPVASALAKALAGQAAKTVARHAQQVLAGMGFTEEHPLHRHVRRVLVLDDLVGASRTLLGEIGAEALRTRRLPEMIPL